MHSPQEHVEFQSEWDTSAAGLGRQDDTNLCGRRASNDGIFGAMDLCSLARWLETTLLLFAFACEEGQAGHLEPPAVSREQGALQGEAVFESIQQGVSRANAQLQVLGGLQRESRGGPLPYFEIAYDPTSTDQTRRYSFWRRILSSGKQFFIPNQLYSSLVGEQTSEVEQPSRQTSSAGAHARSDLLGLLPATFVASLPRAHRPDMRYQLELFPDQAFFLRITYLTNGNSLSFDDLGTWAVASERRLLVLWTGRKAPLTLAVKDGNTLRKLDSQGREVASSVDYDLRRTPSPEPLEPRVAMRGMYKYFAGSGRFTECLTGRSWTVSRENDNAALLLAYAKARRRPGDEVLASLFGRVAADAGG